MTKFSEAFFFPSKYSATQVCRSASNRLSREIFCNIYLQVLASKEAHAHGLKRRLGITAWREFSEDMTQGLKNLQDSQAYKKTGEALEAAKTRTASVWSSISNSQSFISASQKMTSMGSAFGSAKSKVVSSFSSQNLAAEAGNNGNANGTEAKEDKIPEEK